MMQYTKVTLLASLLTAGCGDHSSSKTAQTGVKYDGTESAGLSFAELAKFTPTNDSKEGMDSLVKYVEAQLPRGEDVIKLFSTDAKSNTTLDAKRNEINLKVIEILNLDSNCVVSCQISTNPNLNRGSFVLSIMAQRSDRPYLGSQEIVSLQYTSPPKIPGQLGTSRFTPLTLSKLSFTGSLSNYFTGSESPRFVPALKTE